MADTLHPTAPQIHDLFTAEITALGGTVSDSYDDGERLFLRSILPGVQEVRPRDKLQGGVALRLCGAAVLVHPYVFRQVCRNGAIMAQALQTRQVVRGEHWKEEDTLDTLAEAIRACGSEEAFTASVERMRSAVEVEADLILNMMPMLAKMPREWAARFFADVCTRFSTERDRSLFGLVNAVTSVARDTEDPEARWHLEELGGGLLVPRQPDQPLPEAEAALDDDQIGRGCPIGQEVDVVEVQITVHVPRHAPLCAAFDQRTEAG